MQVSWIDPEEVASLAKSLRLPPRAKAAAPVPEVIEKETPVEPLVAEQTEAVAEPMESPNLVAFRQRLQTIRERAIRAGLMTPQAPTPAVVESPVAAAAEAPAEVEAPVTENPVVVAEEPSPTVAEEMKEAEASPSAEESPPAISEPTPPTPQISVAPGASVKDRLEAFATWSSDEWGPSELLIVDEYGDLLWGPPKKSGLVLSTMMAWNAAIRASAQAANGASQIVQQTLATGETLTIIPCKTRLGLLQIALVKGQSPADDETSALRDAMVQVMDTAG